VKIEKVASISPQISVRNPNSNNEQARIVAEVMNNLKQEQPIADNFPGEKQLIDIIEKSNKNLRMINSSLQFSVHERTKEIMVKVIDNETKEVIREIPSEKILDMVAAMLERTGLFIDKRA